MVERLSHGIDTVKEFADSLKLNNFFLFALLSAVVCTATETQIHS